ncbi:MAG: SAF domain-containing protein, partial [Actinobacteria bacterium]|nr:SAF domain-containing protein [Actinomycetota bacterium]
MGRRTVAIIAAVVLALGAAGLVWWYSASVRTKVSEGEETQTVLIAREDVAARTKGDVMVQKGLVESTPVPKRLVAPGALTDATALQGMVLISAVAKGQQLVSSQIGTPEAQGTVYQVEQRP